ncbi:MAG: MFS transporter, partial [Polaromonas sp.]
FMSAVFQPSCDCAIAEATAASPAASPAHAPWLLATTILASSLAFIDGSVVNVGLPAIGRSLNESGDALAWVLSSYLLPLSALLLIGGAAGDLYGRRRLLVLGTAIFAAASLLCALAPSLAWLLAGRVLQGIGAALLMPNSLAILGAAFRGEQRGRAIGIWAGAGAAAGAMAPLLGGWLIDSVGWRMIFLLNLPIALAAIGLALRYLPDESRTARPPLDVAGGALATLALAALTWGLTAWSAAQQLNTGAGIALAAGLVALTAFVRVEKRLGERAMLPLGLFASSDFVGLTLLTLLLYGALGALVVMVPYALIESHGYSALAAGAALLPLPVFIALGSSTMGRLAAKVGPRWPLTIAPVVAAAGCALAMRIGQPGSYWTTVFPALVLVSAGMAGAVAPLTAAVLGSVEPANSGVASGLNSATARTGGLVATALLGGLLAAHGSELTAAFRVAALAAAGVALAAGACAFVWVGRAKSASSP